MRGLSEVGTADLDAWLDTLEASVAVAGPAPEELLTDTARRPASVEVDEDRVEARGPARGESPRSISWNLDMMRSGAEQ